MPASAFKTCLRYEVEHLLSELCVHPLLQLRLLMVEMKSAVLVLIEQSTSDDVTHDEGEHDDNASHDNLEKLLTSCA